MTYKQLCAKSETYNKFVEWKKGEPRNGTEDPYENLASAIICYAVDDYRDAIKRRDEVLIEELEEFFRSDWCKVLCGGESARFSRMILRENSLNIGAVAG